MSEQIEWVKAEFDKGMIALLAFLCILGPFTPPTTTLLIRLWSPGWSLPLPISSEPC